jgi:hypothetical protein
MKIILIATMMCLVYSASADNIDGSEVRIPEGFHLTADHKGIQDDEGIATYPLSAIPRLARAKEHANKSWIYLEGSGTVRVWDANGETRFMHYTVERIRKIGGIREAQVQLMNGQWIDLD